MRERKQMAAALAIAGSDPSGGAGIQADLKTMTMLGVYSGAVVACLTVQNTLGVREVVPLEAGLVKRQIEQVLVDLRVTHVKTGMVGSAAVAAAIAAALREFRGEVVCDPVLVASSGKALLAETDLASYDDTVIRLATVLTPNLEELERLAGSACRNGEEIEAAVAELFRRHARLRAVVVKGGHQPEEDSVITDRLFRRSPAGGTALVSICQCHPRVRTANSHGTGCTFASAFTAYHMLTNDDVAAFEKSVELLDRLLRLSAPHLIGHGRGPLLHHLARLTPSCECGRNPGRSRWGRW